MRDAAVPVEHGGQRELVDLHHYLYLVDQVPIVSGVGAADELVARANELLMKRILFSTQRRSNYEKFLKTEEFERTKAATFFSDVCQQIFPGVFANAAAMVTAIVSISEMQGGNGNK